MKLYFHYNAESFSNTYLVANEDTMEALIIDPSEITTKLIDQIEQGKYTLKAALITQKNVYHTAGLITLKKIYDIEVYAADAEISGEETILYGDGQFNVCGLEVDYFSMSGHSSDSLVYKIGNGLFTGDVISAGLIGDSSCNYNHTRLVNEIHEKIFSMPPSNLLFPGRGPLSSVGAEKMFNIKLGEKIRQEENRMLERL